MCYLSYQVSIDHIYQGGGEWGRSVSLCLHGQARVHALQQTDLDSCVGEKQRKGGRDEEKENKGWMDIKRGEREEDDDGRTGGKV